MGQAFNCEFDWLGELVGGKVAIAEDLFAERVIYLELVALFALERLTEALKNQQRCL